MSDTATSPAKVWDLPVRLFHWLLVALIAFSWWSGEEHYLEWHRASGYTILALIVFRLIWGFIGSRTARFSSFVKGPRAVAAYARTLGSRASEAADGHNPLGGWSVVAMLGAVALMVAAGLFATDIDGIESGPLADYVSFDQGRAAAHWHETLFNVILALVILHVAAIAFYRLWKGRNLVGPMIHGRGEAEIANSRASAWKFLVAAAIAAVIAWAASTGFRL